MDNPNEQSSSTRAELKEQGVIKNQPCLLRWGAQRFEDIVNMPSFVDHTHFIKHFLKDDLTRLAIFAPRRFGKSTHLSMVRRFLEIDIDEKTGEVSSSVNGPAKQRKNYKLFEKTRIIDDASSKELVEAHLGRHPVIYLDFKTTHVNSVETAKEHCRQVVRKAYSEHGYLEYSTKLIPYSKKRNARAQERCEKWCDEDMCKTQNLSTCLENLTKYLYNHCNKTKVYILVDEFDAINSSAIQSIADEPGAVKKLQAICGVLTNLLETVTKGEFSNAHVAGVLLTGVSYVCGMGFSPQFNNMKKLKFLDGDTISEAKHSESREFVPFYGATREEVEDVINKLVKNKQLVNFEDKQEFLNDAKELDAKKIFDAVELRYNGYCDINGVQVFCLWSVLQYLEHGIPKNYWHEQLEILYLSRIFKNEAIASTIINLMRGNAIEFVRTDALPIEGIVKLFSFLKMDNEVDAPTNIVINTLMDLGYLTYFEDGEQSKEFEQLTAAKIQAKLPNVEIRAALSEMLGKMVDDYWKVVTKSCSIVIDGITSSVLHDEKALHSTMLKIYQAIDGCMRPLGGKPQNEVIILCAMYIIMQDLQQYKVHMDSVMKDEQDKVISLSRPDILLEHKKDKKFGIVFELKCNRYKDGQGEETHTCVHALQEARGLVPTEAGRAKPYLPVLKQHGREEVLVIGLSVDPDGRVSLAYAAGMDEKIFYKSEKEPNDFRELYKLHKVEPMPEGK